MTDATQPTFPDAMLPVTQSDLDKAGFPTSAPMAPGLAVFFNDALYNRCSSLARIMSRAQGVMPKHLIGQAEACFAIISRAITWNLDPYAVAMSTYQTPGGSIGFEGKLIQAILENSGKLDGGVAFTHSGDWAKLKGKFRIQESPKGGKYPVPTWTREDATGLSVVVSAKVKGENDRRTLKFDLDSAFPLNSPLWATAPERQICYTAVRAFANHAMPSVLMGIPFDVDPTGFYGEPMQNITPPKGQAKNEFDRPEPTGQQWPTATQAKPAPVTHVGQNPPPAETSPTAEQKPKETAVPKVDEKPAPKEEPPAAEPEPTQAESEQQAEPETQRSAEDELAAWFQDRLAEIDTCQSGKDVMDLRDVVLAQVDDEQAKAFSAKVAEKCRPFVKTELAAAKGVKNVTEIRLRYNPIFVGELEKAFASACDARQREILEAARKPAPKKG